jgi:hypothetical protein
MVVMHLGHGGHGGGHHHSGHPSRRGQGEGGPSGRVAQHSDHHPSQPN